MAKLTPKQQTVEDAARLAVRFWYSQEQRRKLIEKQRQADLYREWVAALGRLRDQV